MKTLIVTLSCLLLSFGLVVATPPLMQVPPAPEISAIKALELAGAYVAKSFPKDTSLYCQSVQLQDDGMRPVRPYRHWDLVYRHAGAERIEDQKSGKVTFGDFHVYVTMTGRGQPRAMTMLPNKSRSQPAVGAVRSAIAVHVASRRWLSFFR